MSTCPILERDLWPRRLDWVAAEPPLPIEGVLWRRLAELPARAVVSDLPPGETARKPDWPQSSLGDSGGRGSATGLFIAWRLISSGRELAQTQ